MVNLNPGRRCVRSARVFPASVWLADDLACRHGRHSVQAFHIRSKEEWVRVVTILGDRKKIEAGFGFAVQFSGQRSAFPQKDDFSSFGKVDWPRTLSNWRFREDPDHFPIRVPGFVLVGGKISLEELLPTALYSERIGLFRLADYVDQFNEAASGRRCANCSRILRKSTNDRRLYCSDHCSQAARQRSYRERQKSAILHRDRKSDGE
jgi:hypothetical protein